MDGRVFLLLNFTHSFTNEWFRGLCHTPGKLVWLPFLKSVCLVTYFSKTISLSGNQLAFSCILALAHYVRGKCQQTWRRPEKLVNIEKCAFGLHMFNFFFFFKEKKLHEWKKTTTSVYSICKKKKKWPVLISCFYATRTRIQCGAWPYLNTCEAVRPFRANTTMLHSGYRGPCLTIRCHELALPPFFSRIKTSLIWESAPPSGIGGASFPRRL